MLVVAEHKVMVLMVIVSKPKTKSVLVMAQEVNINGVLL